MYDLNDPNLLKDKTYQIVIPGKNKVIDASHGPMMGNSYKVNQSFIDELTELVNCEAYAHSK